jgi:LacI family transcriptional regulator
MTTIVDVARAAGVSTATVSRVLNNHPQVDPRLAAIVLQVVKDLGYRPSRVARSLRTRRNRVWALIISDIRTGPFFVDEAAGRHRPMWPISHTMLCWLSRRARRQ